jgi:hypothetical protein
MLSLHESSFPNITASRNVCVQSHGIPGRRRNVKVIAGCDGRSLGVGLPVLHTDETYRDLRRALEVDCARRNFLPQSGRQPDCVLGR